MPSSSACRVVRDMPDDTPLRGQEDRVVVVKVLPRLYTAQNPVADDCKSAARLIESKDEVSGPVHSVYGLMRARYLPSTTV